MDVTTPNGARSRGGAPFHVEASYLLLNDNLLDLSHVAYVHAGSIGTGNVADFPILAERGEDFVRMSRMVEDSPPPPLYGRMGGFEGNVDRWQVAGLDAAGLQHRPCRMRAAGYGRGRRAGRHQGRVLQPQRHDARDRDHHALFLCARQELRARRPGDGRELPGRFPPRLRRGHFHPRRPAGEYRPATGAPSPSDINVDGPGLAFRRMLARRIEEEGDAR